MDVNEEVKAQILSRPIFKGVVVTGSMDPVIKVGETVIATVKEADLKRFDIILFVQDQKLICHYLWRMNRVMKPLLMQTRSLDGKLDLPLKEENYIGKVVSHRIGFWRRLKIILS